jgi:hypothetical protein
MATTPGILDKQWDEYRKLRGHFWKMAFCGPLLFGLAWIVLLVGGPHIAKSKLVGTLVFGCLGVWFIMYIGALFRLRAWPCPVCGKRFSFAWWSSWPGDTCKHCGTEAGVGPTRRGTE